jgi:hypothetical protein
MPKSELHGWFFLRIKINSRIISETKSDTSHKHYVKMKLIKLIQSE